MFYKSELRRDLVSGDWIVIVPKRSKKPKQFLNEKKRIKIPKAGCPFEDPQTSGHKDPMLIIDKSGKAFSGEELKEKMRSGKMDWALQVIPNKFPAFIHEQGRAEKNVRGPYEIIEGVGHHELVITRDHEKNFPKLSEEAAFQVFQSFQLRYRKLASEKCSAYVSIFHNWGPKAGASIYHPHYQIIGIPVVPPDVEHSLRGSSRYYKKHRKCVHCVMLEWEKKDKKRIVCENDGAMVFAPFVSREPFEMRVFPKKHSPYFEEADHKEIKAVAAALKESLRLMGKNLKDPDYNFFVHTAPIAGKNKYPHYHWHIEVQPKISISAGFELSTGIEITVVDPDEAAKILKGEK